MKYRIKSGKHRTKVDGRLVTLKPGDVFEPTAKELKAFKDKLSPVDTEDAEDSGVDEDETETQEGKFQLIHVSGRGKNKKFNVVDEDESVLNDEPLSKEDAEAFIALKLEEGED